MFRQNFQKNWQRERIQLTINKNEGGGKEKIKIFNFFDNENEK